VRNLPEAQRAPKEIELLAKLASSRAAALDMRAIETYEALAARAAHYGLIDQQVRALIDLSYPLSLLSAEHCLEALRRALRLSAQQDPIARTHARELCVPAPVGHRVERSGCARMSGSTRADAQAR
jgi:hypothetical protein